VLVAIDDVQWLDAPTVGVVRFAARRVRSEPVGFLVSERVASPGAAPRGLDLTLGPELVSVGPMTMGALHRLIHERLDVAFSRPALHRIHELSGGNPFFAVELARAGALSPDQRPPNQSALSGV
jgi:hypothetical protein